MTSGLTPRMADVMLAIHTETLSVAAERREDGDLPEGWIA